MLSLSVLDQSTIVTGRSPDASIRESIRPGEICEDLGYARTGAPSTITPTAKPARRRKF